MLHRFGRAHDQFFGMSGSECIRNKWFSNLSEASCYENVAYIGMETHINF